MTVSQNKVKGLILSSLSFPQKYYQARKIIKQNNFSHKIKRIYHFHNRKTAGTSINISILDDMYKNGIQIYKKLYKTFGYTYLDNKKIVTGWNKYLLQKGYYHFGFSHLPMYQIKIPKNTFTFSVFRNPIDRTISYYSMLKRLNKNNDLWHLSKDEKVLSKLSLEDFINSVPKFRLNRQLYMFSKNYNLKEALENAQKLNHVMFLEDFNRGIKKLSNKIGANLKTKHLRKSKNKPNLTNKQIKLLNKKLVKEISFYNQLKKLYF